MQCEHIFQHFSKATICFVLILSLIMIGAAQNSWAQDAKEPSPTEKITLAVKQMQQDIADATEKLKKVSEGDLQTKHEELETVIGLAEQASLELQDDKELFQTLLVAIDKTKKLKEQSEERASDPNVDGEMRVKYNELANKLDKAITDLYEKKLLIGKQREGLSVTIKKLNDQSDYIALALAAMDVESANEALSTVLTSISDLNTSFLTFAKDMGVQVEQEAETQPE